MNGVGMGFEMLLKIEENGKGTKKERKRERKRKEKKDRKKDLKITSGKNVKVHYTYNCFIILEIVSDAA